MALPHSQQLLLVPEQMAELDRRTIEELGIPGLHLMEAAAVACVEAITTRYSPFLTRGSLILCGPGNNGGDGLAIARLLADGGHRAEVVLLRSEAGLSGDAATQLERAHQAGVAIRVVSLGDQALNLDERTTLEKPGLMVDALFGMGLCRDLEGVTAELVGVIERWRDAGVPVLSVDIPSGVDGGSGQVLGAAVAADLTVSFAAPKRGHYQEPGRSLRGELVIADIGIPRDRWPEVTANASTLLTSSCLLQALPDPSPASHKGSFGHVLVVAGGPGKAGAARLCAEAALRGGAGLVTLAIPEGLPLDSLAELRPEVMVERVPGSEEGSFSVESLASLVELCVSRDVLAVGPGIGTSDSTSALIRELFVSAALPGVFDADALNCLVGKPAARSARYSRVITPHPGEARRLILGLDAAIPGDRVDEALLLANSFGCVSVLKGAATVVAAPDGVSSVNPTGNVGMATAGSGDVLTGVVAALMARGASAYAAACGGVFWHGHAGDLAARRVGGPAMLAGDISETLGAAWVDLGSTA